MAKKTMSPSVESKAMTDGQIDKAVDAYRAMLRKHRSELGSEAAQQVLCQDGYLNEQFAVLRRRVEAISNLIVRRVPVNRARSSEEVIAATGRVKYVNDDVVKTMPRGKGEEVEVIFFKPRPEAYKNGVISDDDLEKEFEYFGLDPAFPDDVSAVNGADPDFADEHPNGTYWKDKNGKWCYIAFYRWDGARFVDVNRHGYGWLGLSWFAGLRKSSQVSGS